MMQITPQCFKNHHSIESEERAQIPNSIIIKGYKVKKISTFIS